MFLVLLPISTSWSLKFGFSWSWFCGQLQSILVLCNCNLCAVLRNVLLGTGVGPILWFCYNLRFLVCQKFQNKTTHDSKALPGFLKELAFQGRFFDLFFGLLCLVLENFGYESKSVLWFLITILLVHGPCTQPQPISVLYFKKRELPNTLVTTLGAELCELSYNLPWRSHCMYIDYMWNVCLFVRQVAGQQL